jgi:hypothetical protein
MTKRLNAPSARLARLPSDVRYVRTLQRAMELVGGEPQLAAILRTSPSMLRRWLSGYLQPPVNKYITALQLVTGAER